MKLMLPSPNRLGFRFVCGSQRVALVFAGLLFVLGAAGFPAHAHKASDSFLTLHLEPHFVRGRWDIALRDLEPVLGLDADRDGRITWGEMTARRADLERYVFARLRLHDGNADLPLRPTDLLTVEHSDGGYAVLTWEAPLPTGNAPLELEYTLFAAIDAGHRGLVRVVESGGEQSFVMGGPRVAATISRRAAPAWTLLPTLVPEGVRHILTGYDHLLFLAALLLPFAVPGRTSREGLARPVFGPVLKIVTAFTVAHSLTLALAAAGWVRLPSRWIETVIAASIVLAALRNLGGDSANERAGMAFGFGLIHGLGFASVLGDFGLTGGRLGWGLIGFNLGVELGQLACVAGGFALVRWARPRGLAATWCLRAGSISIAGVALVWAAERALDTRWLPF